MRNPLIEAILESEGVEYDYLDSIPTDKIDRNKSGGNQSRHEPIIKENVANMRQSIRAGVDLFALVAYEDRPGVFVLMDGNNRLSALDAEKVPTTDIYRVRTDDASRRIALTYAINPTNGVPTPPEQQALQAVNLLAHGYSAARTAEILGVTKTFVNESRIDTQGLEHARRLGVINQWTKITARSTRVALQRNIALDNVFSAMVRFAAAFDLTYNKVKPVIDAVSKMGTEDEQLAHITAVLKEEKRVRDGKRKGNPTGPPPTALVRAHLNALIRTDLGVFQGMDDVQTQAMVASVDDALVRLSQIRANLTNGVK